MTSKGKIARDAIEAVFSDTSVDQQVTLDDLQELKIDIESKIDALKCDLHDA